MRCFLEKQPSLFLKRGKQTKQKLTLNSHGEKVFPKPTPLSRPPEKTVKLILQTTRFYQIWQCFGSLGFKVIFFPEAKRRPDTSHTGQSSTSTQVCRSSSRIFPE